MGICLITGSHPRHRYLANSLYSSGKIVGWVIEEREEFVPRPPEGLDRSLSDLFVHHFSERERIENEVFAVGSGEFDAPVLSVSKDSLNDDVTSRFVADLNPKLVISYGCHKLSRDFMARVGCRFWNVHGGLSPEYRGVITHFWPSYFLEPQMTGVTLHETTDFLDAGAIVFQTAASLVRGDTLHRLAARNVEHFASQLGRKLRELELADIPLGVEQKGYGKVFMARDWRPEHLRVIYEVYDDGIVDAVLDGRISGRTPELVSVL